MKILIYAIVISYGTLLPGVESNSANEEITEYVADDFNVLESDVTLISPNLVLVETGVGSSQGVATFIDCGNECTRVIIDFSDRTLELQVIEDISGI